MKPPYHITDDILRLVEEVSRKIGEAKASFIIKPSPQLRKRNRIKSIQASLAIEGNSLTEDQVTAILENKKVVGPASDIREVTNAIHVYDQLPSFNPFVEKAILKAHQILMKGLIPDAGQYRKSSAGIAMGKQIAYVAPPVRQLPGLMKDLFSYLKNKNDLMLIKSCVFHYELEFIHPFTDGNGRMGRLWQTLLLMQEYPIMEYLPFETIISKNQKKYYQALSASDKQGSSTLFIEFMLKTISTSLDQLLKERPGPVSASERIESFLARAIKEFTRKDYLDFFKTISSATASRDLKLAADQGLVKKKGEKNKTVYKKG